MPQHCLSFKVINRERRGVVGSMVFKFESSIADPSKQQACWQAFAQVESNDLSSKPPMRMFGWRGEGRWMTAANGYKLAQVSRVILLSSLVNCNKSEDVNNISSLCCFSVHS